MTVNTSVFLRNKYNLTKALGDKALSSDFSLVIEGFEHLQLLIKQAPTPVTTVTGEIEVATPMGAAMWQAQQQKVNQQGQCSIYETVNGHVREFLEKVITQPGGLFQAVMYEGTPDYNYGSYKLVDAFFQPDPTDRDWESRSQVVTVSGSLFYHFFAEKGPARNVP